MGPFFNICTHCKTLNKASRNQIQSHHTHPMTNRSYPMTNRPHFMTNRPHPMTNRPHFMTNRPHPMTNRPHPMTNRPHPMTNRPRPIHLRIRITHWFACSLSFSNDVTPLPSTNSGVSITMMAPLTRYSASAKCSNS